MREIMRTMDYPTRVMFLVGVVYAVGKIGFRIAEFYTMLAVQWLFTPVR